MSHAEADIDGRTYALEVHQRVAQPADVARLIVIAYQATALAGEVLRVCIESIRHVTASPYELWVVDNHSPAREADWVLQYPDVNVILNRTEPVPPSQRTLPARMLQRVRGGPRQTRWGSYANAVGLEIAVRLIEPQTRHLMSLHMDTMPCHPDWLSFLQSKLGEGVAASGVRLDTVRTPEGVLHVLGMLVDFQLFRRLALDFYPALPRYDVGDRVTVSLRQAGYEVYACGNTLWEHELVEQIPLSSAMRHLHVDRSFDDAGNVIFMHLGRGVHKSSKSGLSGTSAAEWVRFAEEQVLV